MQPAINAFCQTPDRELPDLISTGIQHILANASKLDGIARQLFALGELRGSNVMRRLAKEEASKVLVLIDFVRCPLSRSKERSETLKSFYGHVAKGIYAQTCDWRPATFKDISEYVEWKTAGFYLDGPNDVDWIFRNDIVAAREWAIYVDYVQDITVDNGEYMWHVPTDVETDQSGYSTPRSLRVSLALSRCGATSTRGLRIVSNIWRNYQPNECSTNIELLELIVRTLSDLRANDLYVEATFDDERCVLDGWAFPLWSLELRDLTPNNQKLTELRRRRKELIERWVETEKQRQPALVVSRDAVVCLSEAFNLWQNDINEIRDAHFEGQQRGLRIEPASLMNQYHELDSYQQLERMLCELTESERIDLIALAWFTRQRPADWPQNHHHAVAMIKNLDSRYQTGLGQDWLRGLELWESDPTSPVSFDLT